ncbi:ParB/RepB/Spo0J family partition protein [Arenimonas caeni]|nr:ParB/RepB/Spo0J family partition protein [Arenimonas caeni]
MSPIMHVPLSKLRLSPLNARKTGGSDVSDLAANIAASGLLQNLIVAPSLAGADEFEVIAGGRRLTALQLLEREGRLPDAIATDGVPCRRIDDAAAIIEASTAENTIRAPLHPADQFEAFRAMVVAGKSVTEIAAHFSIGEVVVRQRLKLANVHPRLVQAYREDEATLEQLQALAVTDDHTAQLDVWNQARDRWERDPRELRRKLTAREIPSTDPRVLFVGLAAYEAAGGAVRRDLFSTREDAFLADGKLLDRLVEERAAELVDAVQAEGWSWVEFKQRCDYAEMAEYGQHPTEPTHQKPTAADKARIKEIDKRLEQLDKLLVQMDEDGRDDTDEFDQLCEEQESLEGESQRLTAGTEIWPEDVKAVAGALLVLDVQGGVQIHRGRLQPGQSIKAGKVAGQPKPADKPKKPEISDALVRRLTAHRTLALQAELAANPDVALKAVVHTLIEDVERGLGYETPSPLKLSLRQADLPDSADLKQAPAKKALQLALKGWRDKGLPTTAAARRAWIFQQPTDVLLGLLALAAAYSVDAVHGKGSSKPAADALAADLKLDMATWWAPDAENYLGAVPKALVIEAVAEACGKDEAAALVSLKSAPAVAEAAKKLAGTGWLPKVLRGPGYAVGVKPKAPAKAKPATKPKKHAKKATPKKSTTAKKTVKPAAKATTKKGAKK